MAKDPVCGMQVDPTKAAGSSDFQGKTYAFCSAGCKRKFDSNPAQYTSTEFQAGLWASWRASAPWWVRGPQDQGREE
jgi:YHS domain-containing protein